MVSRQDIEASLREKGQQQVLQFWEELTEASKSQLLAQIAELDLDSLTRIYRAADVVVDPRAVEPYLDVIRRNDSGREAAREAGEVALRRGRAGTLLVAGGQGSRLGFDGPKGAYVLGAVSQRTLFEIHAQRLRALGERYGVIPPLYLMTSASNHQETLRCFAESDNFGLPDERLFIFEQGLAPALDTSGRILLSSKDSLLLAPNGNGGLFSSLDRSGGFDHMSNLGVDVISYVHVDNPLALSCDPVFVGYHLLRESQYSLKALPKTGPYEKVGNFALVEGRLSIIEYNDIPDDMVTARNENKDLLFGWGSPGFFLFSRDFARDQARRRDLPVHKAHKKMSYMGADGVVVDPESPNALKLESYAHDTLPEAARSLVLECDRNSEFAPVKNATGVDSAESARTLMTELFRGWLVEAGAKIKGSPQIEISPLRALDAESLAASNVRELVIDKDTYLQ